MDLPILQGTIFQIITYISRRNSTRNWLIAAKTDNMAISYLDLYLQ
jgi:hypothetical protein